MRRQSIFFFVLSVFTMILGSCTLSMEEWLLSEEEKGVYEPYTYKSDIAEVTYQFNEGVKPITDNVMEYFAAVESDTIIYFKDNVPQEWMPQVGGYVMIGCNMEFPIGYYGKVLERSNTNGLIRLKTTQAQTHEIFKDLKYTIDMPMTILDIPEDWTEEDYRLPDSVQGPLANSRRRSRASMDDKKIFLDYSYVKDELPELYEWQMKKHFPSRLKESRGEDMPEEKKDRWVKERTVFTLTKNCKATSFDKGKYFDPEAGVSASIAFYEQEEGKAERQKPGITVSLPQLVTLLQGQEKWKEKAFEALQGSHTAKSFNVFTKYTVEQSSKVLYHADYDKETDTSEDWTDTEKTVTGSLTVGFDIDGKAYLNYPSDADKAWNAINTYHKNVRASSGSSSGLNKLQFFRLNRVIIVGPGLAFTVNGIFEVGVKVNVGISGTVSVQYETGEKAGNKQFGRYQEPIKEPHPGKITTDIQGEGHFDAGIYVVIGGQILAGGCVGIGAEITGSAGVKMSVSSDNYFEGGSKNKFTAKNMSSKDVIHPYTIIQGVVYGTVSPMGLELYKQQIDLPENDFCTLNYYGYPTFSNSFKSIDARFVPKSGGTYLKATLPFKSLGFYPTNKTYEPRLRVYVWTRDHKFDYTKDNDIFRDDPDWEIKPEVAIYPFRAMTYEFDERVTSYECPLVADCLTDFPMIILPCLYSKEYDYYLYYPEYAQMLKNQKPSITIVDDAQIKGRKLNSKERIDYPLASENAQIYKFGYVSRLNYGDHIDEVEWFFNLYDSKGKKIKQVTVPIRQSGYKTGYYFNTFEFVYTPKDEGENLTLTCAPALKYMGKYVDDNPQTHSMVLYSGLEKDYPWSVDNYGDIEYIESEF